MCIGGTENQLKETGRSDLLRAQLVAYLDVYKHHYDLFLKGVFLYLAASGAIAGYVFREGVAGAVRETLMLVACFGSLIFVFGCVGSRKWVGMMEERVNRICSELGVVDFPFYGAKYVVRGMAAVAALIGLAALTNFGLLLSSGR